MKSVQFGLLSVVALCFVGFSGCGGTNTQKQTAAEHGDDHSTESKHKHTTDEDHDHKHEPGAHGGTIVSIGQDNYHAEAVFEKGGTIRLFMLGRDESKIQEVKKAALKAYLKAKGDSESESIEFNPEPQDGDSEGMTSVFAASIPKPYVGKQLEVTVPSISIGNERFRISFQSKEHAEADHEEMPDKVSNNEERKLYLVPGGKYSEADVKANGGVVASEKFKGLKAEHDLNPDVGEKICPITLTKANPKFSWIIDGKKYEFCCPPCVDEFVKLAKEKPDEVKEPGYYVKKSEKDKE